MLKIQAHFAKKVPAEVDYSSQTYSAALEIEVASESIGNGQLQKKLNWLWQELRSSVEGQIQNNNPAPQPTTPNGQPRNWNGDKKTTGKNGNGNRPASNKQIKFLIDLAKQRSQEFNALEAYVNQRFNVGIYELNSGQARSLIEEYKSQ